MIYGQFGRPSQVPLPHISGSDVAGTVVEVGEDVTGFRTGDRVVSHSNLSCRICDMCFQEENTIVIKEIFGDFKQDHYGVDFSQYTHLPVNVVKLPDAVSFEDASAISMVGMTAWHMLVDRAKIKPGQTVLIMGGTSGVGMAGIQIAKLYNCDVCNCR